MTQYPPSQSHNGGRFVLVPEQGPPFCHSFLLCTVRSFSENNSWLLPQLQQGPSATSLRPASCSTKLALAASISFYTGTDTRAQQGRDMLTGQVGWR